MSGMMNGAPFYSPPSRHSRCLFSDLVAKSECADPTLADFPRLVAAAIKRGAIKLPESKDAIAKPQPKRGPLADWQIAKCVDCGITFERSRRNLVRCEPCRIPAKDCKHCKKEFRPADRKKVCCSKECSQQLQVASFKAQHVYSVRIPKMVECVICHQIKPVRPSGSGFAMTCSPECATTYRAQKNAERIKK